MVRLIDFFLQMFQHNFSSFYSHLMDDLHRTSHHKFWHKFLCLHISFLEYFPYDTLSSSPAQLSAGFSTEVSGTDRTLQPRIINSYDGNILRHSPARLT